MMHSTVRGLILASAFGGALLLNPAPSRAIFHWGGGCCGRPAPTPVYAPPVVTNYAPTVVNYVPQTCYRPVTVAMPVTAYQPVSACGPCGSPVTVMRPVTSFVQQVQYVPYTTYRMVYSNPCATPACAPTTTYYAAPAAYVAPVAPAPASCCAASPISSSPAAAAAPSLLSPSTTYAPSAAPSTTTTPQPSLPPTGPGPGPSNASPAVPEVHLKPVPDPEAGTRHDPASAPPRLIDPDAHTAARPTVATYRPVVLPQTQASAASPKAATDDGWRQSTR